MRNLLPIVSLVGLTACTVYPNGSFNVNSLPPAAYVAPVYRAPVYVAPIYRPPVYRPPVYVYPRYGYVRPNVVRPRVYFYRNPRYYR